MIASLPLLFALVSSPAGGLCPPRAGGDVVREGAAPQVAIDALEGALAVPGATLEILSWEPDASCAPLTAEIRQPIRGSGRVAVRLMGSDCDGWAWARVRILAPTWVASEAIASGDPLDGALTCQTLEVRAGRVPLTEVPTGAVAARTISAGTVIEARHVRDDRPAPGEKVAVVVRSGALQLQQEGRLVPCGREKICALLPGGKKVEGRWDEGSLVVELR